MISEGVQPHGVGLSDRGAVRQNNEDVVFVADDLGLYLVADGIGGYADGELASAMVAQTVARAWPVGAVADAAALLREALAKANARIRAAADGAERTDEGSGNGAQGGSREGSGEGSGERMGSTVVALHVDAGGATIAHVGDSRAYRFRDGALEAMTVDHSLRAQAAARGGHVGGRFGNLLTRALGIAPEVEVEVRREPVRPGDLFLLCSDGLSNMVEEDRIAQILRGNPSLEGASGQLVTEAIRNGGRDNVSVVLVGC
jgi:serine/threonine protein phosphatase PrpC